jgi:hypothetical protein
LAPGAFDQRPVEARIDVLVYSTPPFQQDFEVTGPVGGWQVVPVHSGSVSASFSWAPASLSNSFSPLGPLQLSREKPLVKKLLATRRRFSVHFNSI